MVRCDGRFFVGLCHPLLFHPDVGTASALWYNRALCSIHHWAGTSQCTQLLPFCFQLQFVETDDSVFIRALDALVLMSCVGTVIWYSPIELKRDMPFANQWIVCVCVCRCCCWCRRVFELIERFETQRLRMALKVKNSGFESPQFHPNW